MKVMSIIGIVWFSLSLICVLAFRNSLNDEAAGWGMLGMLYAIPYSIVGLIMSNKTEKSTIQQLIELSELKEKGILSEDEFNAKKNDLLKM
ncbi:MAG: SHOCT domain-containing protein [Bacteroidia bacterium]|nr:SHOCT domain-containing protein [Bacteroidia bacterium]